MKLNFIFQITEVHFFTQILLKTILKMIHIAM